MPAIHYTLQWPDARTSVCYSPSLVIQDYLRAGDELPLHELLQRVRAATAIANERVQAKFGFTCSRANEQLAATEARIAQFGGESPAATVRVIGFSPAD